MEYDHIHPDFRHVLALSDQERKYFLQEQRWIGYPSAKYIIDTMQSLMAMPKRTRMPNLLIVGDSNNGKTSIIERFKSVCGQGYVDDSGEAVKPVIVTEVSNASEKGFLIGLLECFFAPYKSGSIDVLRPQVLHLFRKCQVQILVIDEIHSMLTGTAREQREIMNGIKYLCNQLRIPVVGFGLREATVVLHTDKQHTSRFDVLSLPLWELNPQFQTLLKDFESILPLKKKSGLHTGSLATALHTISQGNLGDLQNLLVRCATAAIDSGTERIDLDIIEAQECIRRTTHGMRERTA
ncbi:hypothetical protein SAMN05192549_1274 [Duganella sacchari]|uniref:TniB protein n=1 Tax=Duganella sacchari TaxID=551987 RepID=A0A1M7RF77_9BURK|nr:TniB family NTP-binding protein [Duganella sacchari]SHN44809.1 hypothetical protein SAMN05192549_1274 [Duganella sacchari]